jgi:hypothetical protein
MRRRGSENVIGRTFEIEGETQRLAAGRLEFGSGAPIPIYVGGPSLDDHWLARRGLRGFRNGYINRTFYFPFMRTP